MTQGGYSYFFVGNAHLEVDFVNGKYLWRVTGKEVDPTLQAPYEPHGQPCVYLWSQYYGLDDSHMKKYKVLCEKVQKVELSKASRLQHICIKQKIKTNK